MCGSAVQAAPVICVTNVMLRAGLTVHPISCLKRREFNVPTRHPTGQTAKMYIMKHPHQFKAPTNLGKSFGFRLRQPHTVKIHRLFDLIMHAAAHNIQPQPPSIASTTTFNNRKASACDNILQQHNTPTHKRRTTDDRRPTTNDQRRRVRRRRRRRRPTQPLRSDETVSEWVGGWASALQSEVTANETNEQTNERTNRAPTHNNE